MPLPTPFHPRTSALCTSLRYKDWAGYYAVCSYDSCHEREYYAFRHSAGLIDVSPLHKYDIRGQDAAALLSRIMARDVSRLKPQQVAYGCWCDDHGKVVDDGTVWHLDANYYRLTSAEPALAWLLRHSRGWAATITDVSDAIAALSLQGPRSRVILEQAAGTNLGGLRFFRLQHARIAGFDATITRTGYTGDLGYEVWVDRERALALWDTLMEAGRPHGLMPAALDAMDITRVEAGFVLNGVDYFSAPRCLIEMRKSTPFELGLGWAVQLDREPFIGQAALQAEHARGPARAFVCLDIDWDELAALYAKHGLPPEVPHGAWRSAIPVYNPAGTQVGQATSGAWSPILKKNLALATVEAAHQQIGTPLKIEATVEYRRCQVKATVVDKPLFDPPRKRA